MSTEERDRRDPREPQWELREWTLQLLQWGTKRQTNLKEKLRANQSMVKSRVGKVKGAMVQR